MASPVRCLRPPKASGDHQGVGTGATGWTGDAGELGQLPTVSKDGGRTGRGPSSQVPCLLVCLRMPHRGSSCQLRPGIGRAQKPSLGPQQPEPLASSVL